MLSRDSQLVNLTIEDFDNLEDSWTQFLMVPSFRYLGHFSFSQNNYVKYYVTSRKEG